MVHMATWVVERHYFFKAEAEVQEWSLNLLQVGSNDPPIWSVRASDGALQMHCTLFVRSSYCWFFSSVVVHSNCIYLWYILL